MQFLRFRLLSFFLTLTTTFALQLDINNTASIKNAAATVAYGMQISYNGNQSSGTIGKWPSTYWWEAGAAWGGMIHYWHYTGDTSYVKVTYDALVGNIGPTYDFNLTQEAWDEGNDDQEFWAFAAMDAVEYGFPAPPAPIPSWLTVVKNTWNDLVSRWDTSTCAGGLKWQFHPNNGGYNYKNSISQGGFFLLSARLARYTGDPIYVEWAERIYNWTARVGLIDQIYNVYDGTDDTINCTALDHHQWTYNVGVFMFGSAVMQNYTNTSQTWATRTLGFLDAATLFLVNSSNILYEAACELDQSCNWDELSMKGYLARWMATTAQLAPYTAPRVNTILQASAKGAAAACSGGAAGGVPGTTCGFKWYINGYDNNPGLGQQICALDVIQALLASKSTPPATGPGVVVPIGSNTLPVFLEANSTSNPLPTSTSRTLHDQPSRANRTGPGWGVISLIIIPLLSGLSILTGSI